MRVILFVVACLALVAGVSAKLTETEYQNAFTQFITQYNREYAHDSFFYRYNVFKQNLDLINNHNALNSSYRMGLNAFADMTAEEFKATHTGLRPIQGDYARQQNTVTFDETAPLADSLDWRTKGIVNAVKDQAQCGSCWAFSAIASAEGAVAQKTGTLLSLSEQQLVDCSTSYGNAGCNGGWMDYGFEYIIAKGSASESAYPYKAVDQTCKSFTSVASLSGYKDIPANNEAQLLAAANIGVVSVAIEADTMVFQFYTSGVLDNTGCGTTLDHGVAVVGYGTDAGKDYWIVRNSWGQSWGEQGYVRIVRNKNMCGINMAASYAVA
jgi:C1A family cysteine protease